VPIPRHVLLLEDDASDAALVSRALSRLYPQAHVEHAGTRDEFLAHLAAAPVDVVVSDSSVRGCEGLKAFYLTRERKPHVGFVYLTGFKEAERDLPALKAIGVTAFLTKPDLGSLGPAIEEALVDRDRTRQSIGRLAGYERLVGVLTELSQARDRASVLRVVCAAARDLAHADGATFALHEGAACFYAEEDAMAPLWKGRRFPASGALCGWAMAHRQPAIAADVFTDPRVPLAVSVPVRAIEPVGAIGVYWAEPTMPHPQAVRLLQALADATAVALDNAGAFEQLHEQVKTRGAEAEAFAYAVSHDLRTPVRHIAAFADRLAAGHGHDLGAGTREAIDGVLGCAGRMRSMIDGLIECARAAPEPIVRRPVDLARLARELDAERAAAVGRGGDFVCPASLPVTGDEALLRRVLQNLLDNAWKFSSMRETPRVELGVLAGPPDVYFVRDNGAGFDPQRASKLFGLFQRLHRDADFPGTGVGLAIVQRIVGQHGGRVWAESRPDEGATFFFTLTGGEAPAASGGR